MSEAKDADAPESRRSPLPAEAAASREEATSLESITDVLVAVASGNFAERAPRNYRGDPWDVLAFLVNETAEEVHRLVSSLKAERENLVEAQQKLHDAEKLASLGELAGGVAHELNQPLTVMQTLTELLLEKPEMTIEERRRELEMLALASRRMGRVVTAVRTFGRRAPLHLLQMSILTPVDEAVELLRESLSSASIELIREQPSQAPWIAADQGALAQVFINLLGNARDVLEGLPPSHPRRVAIRVSEENNRAIVAVDDSGPGVPPTAVGRLFDPFFSTKTVGKGTGLGLSISHGLVVEHGGTLDYRTNEWGGASFVVSLPIAGSRDS